MDVAPLALRDGLRQSGRTLEASLAGTVEVRAVSERLSALTKIELWFMVVLHVLRMGAGKLGQFASGKRGMSMNGLKSISMAQKTRGRATFFKILM